MGTEQVGKFRLTSLKALKFNVVSCLTILTDRFYIPGSEVFGKFQCRFRRHSLYPTEWENGNVLYSGGGLGRLAGSFGTASFRVDCTLPLT
jgi:hypothetical protein